VMATIANKEGVIQWAVFFGTKYQDNLRFEGKVNGLKEELKWLGPRPIWLIPISCEAKDEAARALNDGHRSVPRIWGHQIVIRNPKKENEEYQFWYDGNDQWKRDLTLVLSKDAYLEKLSGNGQWKILQQMRNDQPDQYEKEWPIWITTCE